MIEFLQGPTVSLFISLFGLIFSILSVILGYFSIKSYFDQKKFSAVYNQVFDNAQKNLNGKYTEEQLTKLKSQFSDMNKQVTTTIPLMARKVLLEMKLEMLVKEISDLTHEYETLKNEYGNISSSITLNDNIMKYIEEEIKPKSKSKNATRNMMLIISIAFVFIVMNSFASKSIENLIFFTIYKSNANLNIYQVGTYLSGLIIVMGITYNFDILKLLKLKRLTRIKTVLISFMLFFLWIISIIVISYDLIYRDYTFQLIVGMLSLFLFSVGIKLFTHFFKK